MTRKTTAPSKAQDMGDFQTPAVFTDRICEFLAKTGLNPSIILEPTVGEGNFVFSSIKCFPALQHVYAIDIQEKYEQSFMARYRELQAGMASRPDFEFHHDNIFSHVFTKEFLQRINNPSAQFLIIGNPPWITNAGLSRLASDNVPRKSNLKSAKGLDALTGKANFDIAESIALRLLEQFSNIKCHIALLLKTSVIRNLIRDLPQFGFALSGATAFTFDAKREFGIAASAALFVARLGDRTEPECKVASFGDLPKTSSRRFGYVEKQFVSNIDTYAQIRQLEGACPFAWRQGLKHDAAAVMLVRPVSNTTYINSLGETVELEDELLFPFAKGSDIANNPVIQDLRLRVIVPQTKLGQDTQNITERCPKLWQYLLDHRSTLDARKSAMYRDKPRFSIFGVGPYAFHPYKVGIGSFYKTPTFSLILPVAQKPVMLDDTSYYMGFDNLSVAVCTWVTLNLPQVRKFLGAIAFIDTKRPYSKEILARIDLQKVLASVDYASLYDFYAGTLKSAFEFPLDEVSFSQFKQLLI